MRTVEPIFVRPGLVFDPSRGGYFDDDGVPAWHAGAPCTTGPNSSQQPGHPFAEAVTHYQAFDWGFFDLAPANAAGRPLRMRERRSDLVQLLDDAAAYPDAFAAARLDPDMIALRVTDAASLSRLEGALGKLPPTAEDVSAAGRVLVFRVDGEYTGPADGLLITGVEAVHQDSAHVPVWPTPGHRWTWRGRKPWSWSQEADYWPQPGWPSDGLWIPQPSELPFLPEQWQRLLVLGEIDLSELHSIIDEDTPRLVLGTLADRGTEISEQSAAGFECARHPGQKVSLTWSDDDPDCLAVIAPCGCSISDIVR